jgi:hypothetical protein
MIERVAIIMVLNLIFYFKTLKYSYVSDDIRVFKTPTAFRNKWEKRYHQIEGRSRVNPAEDHAVTISIHAVVSALVYLAFGANDVSFIAALLFSFNPINNQGSTWISGRGYVMATLGLLGALAFPYLAAGFLLLGAYYNAGYLSLLCLIGSPYPWIMMFVPFVWVYHYKRFTGDVKQKMAGEMFYEDKLIKPQKLILVAKTFGFYVCHALIPTRTTFYHSYLQSLAGSGKEKGYSIKDKYFWFGIIFILLILYKWIFTSWDVVSFGLLWWCVGIAPFLNFYRCQQEISERYTYLPLPGLMVALSFYIAPYPVIVAAFIAMYATRMWFYINCYMDDYYLAELACFNSPDAWFAWHVRAMKRWDTGSFTEAAILWTMAKIISPKEFKVLYNLATVLRLAKHEVEAQDFLRQASENIPRGQEGQANKLIDDWKQGKMCVLL